MHPAPRHVRFHADDRLDACRFARAVKVDHAEHRAVIGDRQRVHPGVGGALDQPFDLAQAVEQAEFGVDVQMDKIFLVGHGGSPVDSYL